MITSEEIKASLTKALPVSLIETQDLTGGGDHWQLIVVSPAFPATVSVAGEHFGESSPQAVSTAAAATMSIERMRMVQRVRVRGNRRRSRTVREFRRCP